MVPKKETSQVSGSPEETGGIRWLGSKDSNLDCMILNQELVKADMAGQEGQNPPLRQENITSRSSAQSGHRMRANPQRGLPLSRYSSTTSLTMGLRRAV